MKTNAFLFFGFLVFCATALVACTDEVVLPGHLLGVWKTSEPRFAGCRIEFRQGLLTLGLKTGERENYSIRKIESADGDGPSVRYTIHYRGSEGQKSKLTLLYEPSFGGTLQLKNRPEIWKRTD